MTFLRSIKSTNGRAGISRGFFNRALELVPFASGRVLAQLFLTARVGGRRTSSTIAVPVGRIAVGGSELCVRARGRGPLVLLVHGWQSHCDHFVRLGDNLVRAGYTAVTVDMPAHGESPGRTSSLSKFIESIEQTSKLVGPLHAIVAHSLGATATSLAISRGLDVQGVVLIAPMISFDFALNEFQKILRLSPRLRELTAVYTEARVGISRAEANLMALPPPPIPVVMIHDERDKRTPIEYSRRLKDIWDRVPLVVTSGLGHQRILQDDSVHENVVQFLQRLPRAKTSP